MEEGFFCWFVACGTSMSDVDRRGLLYPSPSHSPQRGECEGGGSYRDVTLQEHYLPYESQIEVFHDLLEIAAPHLVPDDGEFKIILKNPFS